MEEKEIVPLDSEEIYEGGIQVVENSNRKKKRKSKRGFLVFLIVFSVLGIIAYYNFDFIKQIPQKIGGFINNQAPPIIDNGNTPQSTDTSSSNNNTGGQEEAPEDIIPNGSYPIIEAEIEYVGLVNQANIEIDINSMEYTPKKSNDIYAKYGNEAPLVLIIHSACLESYSNGKYYFTSDNFYDYEKNTGDIGRIICDELNNLGINSIHIDDIFAGGGIHSSTQEYERILKDAIKRYPSISYVLNVSRDVLINDDLSMIKPIKNNSAIIKLIVGSGKEDDSVWKENLSFALSFAELNQDICSSVILSPFSLSQEFLPVSIKLDIGAYSNSFEEAKTIAISFSNRFFNYLS